MNLNKNENYFELKESKSNWLQFRMSWLYDTYTSGSSTCTHEEILHGCLGAGRGQRRPAYDTYGLKGGIVHDTWATWRLSRLMRCSWRWLIWLCPRRQIGLHCRCCWLEEMKRRWTTRASFISFSTKKKIFDLFLDRGVNTIKKAHCWWQYFYHLYLEDL